MRIPLEPRRLRAFPLPSHVPALQPRLITTRARLMFVSLSLAVAGAIVGFAIGSGC